MSSKITLITPPDIFENSNKSILFIHLTDQEQDDVSKWLAQANIEEDINLYVYNGEPNVPWLMYALNLCEYKYVNIDASNYITNALSGYALTKSDVFYKTSNENLVAVYSHINQHRVTQVEQFLESVLSDKRD